MHRRAAAAIVLALAAVVLPARTQDAPPLAVEVGGSPIDPARGMVVAVDADDDDESDVVDAAQAARIPDDDAARLRITGAVAARGVRLRVEGPALRLLRDGAPVEGTLALSGRELAAADVRLQAVRASRAAHDAAVIVEGEAGARLRIPATAVALGFLDAGNERMDPSRRAAGVSHEITNSATLPRGYDYEAGSGDPDNVRIEIFDAAATGDEIRAVVESLDPLTGQRRGAREAVILRRPGAGMPFRSPFLRLVGDRMDIEAPGVTDRVLQVALRDRLRIRYASGGGTVAQDLRIGRPGDEDGPLAARAGKLRIRVMRTRARGIPVIGTDDASALAIAREQVAIANEIWVQCSITFGRPELADVALLDPPPRALLAVGDGDGLPAAGGGTIRLRAGNQAIRPVTTRPGATPVQTALAIADALRAIGLRARVTENAPTEFGAGRSADVVVRDTSGALVALSPDGQSPLGTDARQTVRIGGVELADGITEFDNMTAASGTIEERSLLKMLGDDDPTTIDIFVINRFSLGTRQGEAFIEGDGGAIVNMLILDRNGMRQQREAWTQAHEIGHVLLNQPYHPDNVGPDRPWLLMDADNSLGLVTGPKRLGWDECHRVAVESGPLTVPALLSRHDARTPRPTRPDAAPFDPGYPRPGLVPR